MSTTAPSVPPRTKHNILWWIGGAFLVLVLLFLLQLFGPNPPIVVSPQTTHITTPLEPDGLPNYEQYVLDLSRAGVTPENNAAVLLWQALFPAEVDPQHYAAMATELGIERIPSLEDALVPLGGNAVRQQLAAWLIKRFESQNAGKTSAKPSDDSTSTDQPDTLTRETIAVWSDSNSPVVEKMLSQIQKQPWTSDQLPPLADWVRDNEAPLDLIVEASQRPRYYAPSPTLLDKQRNPLIDMLLPLGQSSREASRALPARAMWHLGEGRPTESWQDLLAVHRLSHLFTQSHTLVEQLIAIATSHSACQSTLALLHHGNLTAVQARRVQRDLRELPNFSAMARTLDGMERAAALDAFINVGTGGGGGLFAALGGGNDSDFGNNAFDIVSVDWNLVLRETNRWYDRLAAAARLPDYADRTAAFDQIDSDIQQLVAESRAPARWAAGIVSRQQRSKLVSSIMLGLFAPAIHSATDAEDRANTVLELTRLAAALAVYRAEQGTYPEKLDALVPDVIENLPVDLYNAKSFVYNRDGEGYLLYSLGPNAIDDRGTNERMQVLKGIPRDELTESELNLLPRASAADDISIRVPRPDFALPKFGRPEYGGH